MSATTNPRETRRWLSELARGHRRPIALTILAGTLAGVATIVQMGLLAYLVHQAVIVGAGLPSLVVWLIPLVVAVLVRGLAQGLQGHFAANASERIRGDVRRNLMASWRHAGPQSLKQESPAALSSEWIEQVEALHGYYAHFLPQMVLSAVVPMIILVVVGALDWLAAIFLLLSAPLIPLFMALVGMGAEKLNQQHFLTMGRLSGQFLDKIRGLTTLQLFDATERAAADLEKASDRFRVVTMKTLKVAFLSSAVLEFFSSVAIAVVAIYIGFGLLGYIDYGPADQLTLYSGLFVLMLAPEFFQPLRQLAQHYHDRAAALGAAELLRARMACGSSECVASEAAGGEMTREGGAISQAVVVKDASFAYQPGLPVLDRVSLTVEPGQCLALCGPSGGGKSTLLNLLAGFSQPDFGVVSIFGKPAGSTPFGWLGQSPFLLQGSWADNLRLVAPSASDDDMIGALEKVGLGPLVNQRARGIHSAVSETGHGLSGGQARRLALARVLLADYKLVLLDEPTAGLDLASQRILIEGFRQLKLAGKTLVLATHHQSLLEIADKVLTLDNGGSVHA
ncbi:thiol reductant ABC exporter subunit CydD [Marinobacter zhejiangensis]|uniref:ATP-binding cassette, subfamily C, CydD n=1 Tax=Marinobacter zhejiangensis TaxID=488535 RepID=A0A1I4RXP6_9GAMM|nr:thiol reductant ABC exporter subunit CydD [Marinobacter zhejiangensis]SFM56977.1 ATP-binding cassette, subfamily C, CydD [Marinobacter zhejiangensis]